MARSTSRLEQIANPLAVHPASPDPRTTPQFQLKHATRNGVYGHDTSHIHHVAAMHA
jgi:hypothetical protein